MALSHRLFWVLHRVQAFLAINTRCSVLILVTDLSRTAVTGLCYKLLAEDMCGDRRDFEGFKCFVRAGGVRRGGLVRDMRDRDRESYAGFQSFGCVVRLAWKTNCVEPWSGRNNEMDGWTSMRLEEYKGTASSCWKNAPKSPSAHLITKASNQHMS